MSAECSGHNSDAHGCPVHDPNTGSERLARDAAAIEQFELCMRVELRLASRHGRLKSAHEAHSVIREEFDEYWDEIKANDRGKALLELLQVATMAMKAARDVYPDLLGWALRTLEEQEKWRAAR